MIINGREVHFAFTVGSYCDISDYVVANPDVSTATAKLHKAVFMAKAYNEAHGIDDNLTIEELRALPGADMVILSAEMEKAEKEGTERTVEAVEKKQKGTSK